MAQREKTVKANLCENLILGTPAASVPSWRQCCRIPPRGYERIGGTRQLCVIAALAPRGINALTLLRVELGKPVTEYVRRSAQHPQDYLPTSKVGAVTPLTGLVLSLPMSQRPLTLTSLGSDDRLLAEAARDPGRVVQLSNQIYGLDPLCDAEQLAELHRQLRAAVARAKDPERAVARTLLDQVAARQSPVGARVNILLRDESPRFTPRLVRALWETRERARNEAELKGILDSDAAQSFLTLDLLHAGMLSRTANPDPTYRLTPAGRHALWAISREVLALELGRFPWPHDVRDAQAWAQDEQVALFPFQRQGNDGERVAHCIGVDPSDIGSLSMPSLFGVAGPEPAAPPYHAVAVFYGPADNWTKTDVRTHIGRILEERHTLVDRTNVGNKQWDVTLFASKSIVNRYGDELEDACARDDVDLSLAA